MSEQCRKETLNKSLLIVPAMPNFVPYIVTYTDLLEEQGIEYDIACWNRKGDNVQMPDNYIVYDNPTQDSYSFGRKLYENYRFYNFVRSRIYGKQYRCIFIFTIITGIFFQGYLKRNYSNRYVFDIRDYSPVMRLSLFVKRLKALLNNSYSNVISSDGFKEWLPKGIKYVTTHNVRLTDLLAYNNDYMPSNKQERISILNIGAIRDVSSNSYVIEQLGNKENVDIMFVGDGGAAPILKEFAKSHNIANVSFYGRYKKEDENDWVRKANLINSYLPHTMVGDYLMSNRFYLSVMLRRPLIVNEGCFQAKMVEMYGLGVVVYPEDDMYAKILNYWQNINWNEYNESCRQFIEIVVYELQEHRNIILSAVKL